MYGYISVNSTKLTEEQKARYKSYYCGLCRSLGKKYGALSSLALSYDLSFLSIVLSSLYECDEEKGTSSCLVHPFKKHNFIMNCFSEYAADISVIMAYYKLLDDRNDDKSLLAGGAMQLFRKCFSNACKARPRQAQCIENCIAELSKLEIEKCSDPDLVSSTFGNMMGEVFVYDEQDVFAPVLREFGKELGEFIYLMDAEMDLKSDIKHKNYNPFIYFYDGKSTDEMRLTILKITMEECAKAFEKLPIIDNADIIRNVLYSGVWAKYAVALKKKGGDKHGK